MADAVDERIVRRRRSFLGRGLRGGRRHGRWRRLNGSGDDLAFDAALENQRWAHTVRRINTIICIDVGCTALGVVDQAWHDDDLVNRFFPNRGGVGLSSRPTGGF